MLFRIWLDNIKEMVTCSDYLIDSAGNVSVISECIYYLIDAAGNRCNERSAGKSLAKQRNAYVMRASGYVYDEEYPGHVLYELDIIKYDGDIAIVYFADAHFQAYFSTNDSQWLGCMDMQTEGELVANYFEIKDDPEWAHFLDSIPAWIKPGGK